MNETPESSLQPGFAATPAARQPLKFSLNWITRPVFGILLAAIAIGVLYKGGFYFALFIALVTIAAAREWHRMIAGGKFTEEFLVTSLVVILAVCIEVKLPASPWPWAIIAIGAAISFALALVRRRRAGWEAAGVLYLGIPALSVVMLRILPMDGFHLLLAFFIAIWATDTGALIVGNLIGGPKLWPALSPNKTWAGFFGGIVVAAVAGGIGFVIVQLGAGRGALFAASVGVIAHMGDLLESWAKRNFRVKNSGGLIPGHGGALDRIDSTLLAAPVLALVVLVAGIDPMVLS